MFLLDTRTPGTSREIYGEDSDSYDGTRTRNPSVINRTSRSQLRNNKYIMMQCDNWINSTPFELYSSMARTLGL